MWFTNFRWKYSLLSVVTLEYSRIGGNQNNEISHIDWYSISSTAMVVTLNWSQDEMQMISLADLRVSLYDQCQLEVYIATFSIPTERIRIKWIWHTIFLLDDGFKGKGLLLSIIIYISTSRFSYGKSALIIICLWKKLIFLSVSRDSASDCTNLTLTRYKRCG